MKKKKDILIVDDNRLNRKTFSEILQDGYHILEAENGRAALEALAENQHSVALIILDLIMPEMDGFGFMEEYRKHTEYRDIPVIVATTDDDVENERRCLKLGVWDFIPKKFHPDIIRFRVLNAIRNSKIRALEYDSLTNIYNQQKFFQATRDMIDDDRSQQYAFIHFDIERFKMVNSFYGVKEGDRLICFVAEQIRRAMQEYGAGTYGRINGDIFGICMPFDDRNDITAFADKLKGRIKEHTLQKYYLETAAGIYIIEDNDMELSAIYDKASIAAKQCKGHYLVSQALYTKEMGDKLIREQRIINEMDQALQEEQFVVYFQPKYELEKFMPYGAEALVRWQRPDGALVSPGEFIPVFEQNGFIIKLDYYVWEKVCQFIRSELDAGREPEPISVNVSRVNLYNPKFLESIINLVEKYKIAPRYLSLELTESAFSDNERVVQDSVDYLHKAGFTILMDDFGSGYSSLNVLKDINLDVLKLDMKFFSQGKVDVKGTKIIEAVIRMAESLKLPVIAEGVEEKHQVEMLRDMGCNFIQGYYFAKPMPMVQYQQLVEKSKK